MNTTKLLFNFYIMFMTLLLSVFSFENFAQDSTKFIVFGDTRDDGISSGENGINDSILAELRKEVEDELADFVLIPGDLIHGNSNVNNVKTELTNWLIAMDTLYQNPAIGVYPCRGNHEVDKHDTTRASFNAFKTAWDEKFTGIYQLPDNGPSGEGNITFSVDKDNILCIGMDQYVGDPFHASNQEWLDSLLFMNDTQHKFIFGHEMAFNVGSYGNGLWTDTTKRNIFWNTIEANLVKAYFCAHNHIYDHARIDGGNGNPSHQYIVGTGGADLYTGHNGYDDNNGFWIPDSIFHIEEKYGYVLVDIDGNDVTIKWKYRHAAYDYRTDNGIIGKDSITYNRPKRQENFTAYNDLAWGVDSLGVYQLRNNIQIITSPNYITDSSGLASVCELVDSATGNPTGVKMRVIGGRYNGDSSHSIRGKEPLYGTDAYNYFNGIVNCLGTVSYVNHEDSNLVIKFRGLKNSDNGKCYDVVFYSDRNKYGWERASLVTLKGAMAFQNLSSSGIDTLGNPLFDGVADSTTRLPSDNDSGYVAHFKFDPGDDGAVELEISYDGYSEFKGKYASAVMLKENGNSFPFNSGLLDCTILLEGPYSALGDSMSTELNNDEIIPLNQPFTDYNGEEVVSEIPEGVVDWVLVELREDTTSTSTVVDTRAGFILSDGKIVDVDGNSSLKFNVSDDDYYVVVKHRNHLSVMSSSIVHFE